MTMRWMLIGAVGVGLVGGCDKGSSNARAECVIMVSAVKGKDAAADAIQFESATELNKAIAAYEDVSMLKNTAFTDATLVGFKDRGVGLYAQLATGLKEIAEVLPKAMDNSKPPDVEANKKLEALATATAGQADAVAAFHKEVRTYCADKT